MTSTRDDELYDWVLAYAPEFVDSMAAADSEVTAGTRGRPLEDVLRELNERIG